MREKKVWVSFLIVTIVFIVTLHFFSDKLTTENHTPPEASSKQGAPKDKTIFKTHPLFKENLLRSITTITIITLKNG